MRKYRKQIEKSKSYYTDDDEFDEEIQKQLINDSEVIVQKMMDQDIPTADIFISGVHALLTEFYKVPQEALPVGSTMTFHLSSSNQVLTARDISTGIVSFCVNYITKMLNEGKIMRVHE